MRQISRILIGFGLLAGMSATATADIKPGAHHAQKWQKIDLNGDSIVDKNEFLSGANQRFSEMDSDANGLVSREERRLFHELRREERAKNKFNRADMNNDGAVSESEFDVARKARDARRQARRLEKHDANNDGIIDEAERETARQQRSDDRMAGRSERQAKREARRGQDIKNRFKPDANNDGVIDLTEHAAAAEHMFQSRDENGDGVLSADEQRPRKRRGKRKHRHSGR